MDKKDQAYQILKNLGAELDDALPGPKTMQAEVGRLKELQRTDDQYRYLSSSSEHVFTRGIALPAISKILVSLPDMTPEKARDALLSETYRNIPDISSMTPARKQRHPFNKAFVSNAQDIYRQWSQDKVPLKQSCPDFALNHPFPHRTLFEAKYFTGGSQTTAQRELVVGAYQTFFYLALPLDTTRESGPDWDYDYSCFFAYDASEEGSLLSAWEQLTSDVKRGFWEGANVYIMILRGKQH